MTRHRGLLGAYLQRIYAQMVVRRYCAQQACLEVDPAAMLLDVGCKDGQHSLELAAAIGTTRVVGLDYNDDALRLARGRGVQVLRADANRDWPLVSESVDVVTAMDVLEHLTDPAKAIAEALRVLKPGGYFVAATPNLASWHN